MENQIVPVENYKALLEAVVDQRASELGTADKSDAFMDVAHALVMDRFDLSVDEVDDGLTDGGGDGQIDAVYVIINGAVLGEDDLANIPTKGPVELDIVLIQSKNRRFRRESAQDNSHDSHRLARSKEDI